MGDCAYGTAETLANLADAGYGDVEARVAPARGRDGRYGKDDFGVDRQAGTVTCPAGRVVAIGFGKDGSGRAAFDGACGGCPLRAACTTSAGGRTVTIHPREAVLQAHKAAQADPAGGVYGHPAQSGTQDRPFRAPAVGRPKSSGPGQGPDRHRCRHPRGGGQLGSPRHHWSHLRRRDMDNRPTMSRRAHPFSLARSVPA
jgi:hypothetical protein